MQTGLLSRVLENLFSSTEFVFLKRTGGWICQADLPLSKGKAVGGTAHSCLPLHSHRVVTWDTLPRLR